MLASEAAFLPILCGWWQNVSCKNLPKQLTVNLRGQKTVKESLLPIVWGEVNLYSCKFEQSAQAPYYQLHKITFILPSLILTVEAAISKLGQVSYTHSAEKWANKLVQNHGVNISVVTYQLQMISVKTYKEWLICQTGLSTAACHFDKPLCRLSHMKFL